MTGMRHRLIVLPALALPCAALAGVAHHPAPKPVHAATAPTPAAVSAPVAATHRAPVARIAAVKAVHHTAQVRHAMHTVGTMAAPVPAPAPAPALAMHALPPAGVAKSVPA